MLIPKPKIVFYAQRSFGQKINTSFDFIKENWKVMFKYFTYFILPLCLVQSLSLNTFFQSIFDFAAISETSGSTLTGYEPFMFKFLASYSFFILCIMVGGVIMVSLLYAFMQLYNDREERLVGITFNDIKPYFFRNVKRSIILSLFSFALMTIVMIAVILLAVMSPFTLILTMSGLIAVSIPLALFMPIYLFEKIGIIDALVKAIRLGFATWGGIFAVTFVMGVIGSILQGVTMMPWYIVSVLKYIFTMSDTANEVTGSTLYSFVIYLLAIVQSFGMYLSMVFTYFGIAYQYSHASEKMDNVSIESDIDNFEQL